MSQENSNYQESQSEEISYSQLPADQAAYFYGAAASADSRGNTLGIAIPGDKGGLTCAHDDKRQRRFKPSGETSVVSSLYDSYFSQSNRAPRGLTNSQQPSRAQSAASRSSRQRPEADGASVASQSNPRPSDAPRSYSRDNYYNETSSIPPSSRPVSAARSQRSNPPYEKPQSNADSQRFQTPYEQSQRSQAPYEPSEQYERPESNAPSVRSDRLQSDAQSGRPLSNAQSQRSQPQSNTQSQRSQLPQEQSQRSNNTQSNAQSQRSQPFQEQSQRSDRPQSNAQSQRSQPPQNQSGSKDQYYAGSQSQSERASQTREDRAYPSPFNASSTEPSVRLYEVNDIPLNEASQRSETSEISGWNPKSRPLSAQQPQRRADGPGNNARSNASSFRPEDPRAQYPQPQRYVPRPTPGQPRSETQSQHSQSPQEQSRRSDRPQSNAQSQRSDRPQSNAQSQRSDRPQSNAQSQRSDRPQSNAQSQRFQPPQEQSQRSDRPQSNAQSQRSQPPQEQSQRSDRPQSNAQSGRPLSERPPSAQSQRSNRPVSEQLRSCRSVEDNESDVTPVRMSSEANVCEMDPDAMYDSHHSSRQSAPPAKAPARKALWEQNSEGTEANCTYQPNVNRGTENTAQEDDGEEQPAPAPVFSRLYADAQRFNRQRTEREKALEMQRKMQRGEIPYDREALEKAGLDVGDDEDYVQDDDGQRGTAAPGEEPRRKSVNFEAFERLSRPTQVTLKREQQKELEEQQKKEEIERQASERKKEYSEVASYNWQLQTKSYTMADLQRQNALYTR